MHVLVSHWPRIQIATGFGSGDGHLLSPWRIRFHPLLKTSFPFIPKPKDPLPTTICVASDAVGKKKQCDLPQTKSLPWKPIKPIGSMYGIFTCMYHKKQPNVGKYTVHGSYGKCSFILPKLLYPWNLTKIYSNQMYT